MKELVPTEKSQWLWWDPDSGQKFVVSPLSGGVAPVGKGFGQPGRSGRKPKVFKEYCNEMLRDPAVQARLRDLAVSGPPADALRAINTAAKYSEPLPRQGVDDSKRVQVFIGPHSKLGLQREPEDVDFEVVEDPKLPPGDEEDYDPPDEEPDA
jgi:hypothetical protein